VESLNESPHGRGMMLRLEEPAAGVAQLGAFLCGGPTMVSVCLYLYGADAAAVGAREEPLWQAWMNEHFPAPSGAGV